MKTYRKSIFVELFGQNAMVTNKLPTYINISRHYLGIYDTNKNRIDETMKCVQKAWKRACITTIKPSNIKDRISRYLNTLNKLRKYSSHPLFKQKITDHLTKYNVLFDISACQCDTKEMCQCESKILYSRWQFIKDQRSERKMYIDEETLCPTIESDIDEEMVKNEITKDNNIYIIEKNPTTELKNEVDGSNCDATFYKVIDDVNSKIIRKELPNDCKENCGGDCDDVLNNEIDEDNVKSPVTSIKKELPNECEEQTDSCAKSRLFNMTDKSNNLQKHLMDHNYFRVKVILDFP